MMRPNYQWRQHFVIRLSLFAIRLGPIMMSQMSDHKASDAEQPARASRAAPSGSDSSHHSAKTGHNESAEAAIRAAVDHFNTHLNRRACIDLYHPGLIL